jgi:hypothetical protein
MQGAHHRQDRLTIRPSRLEKQQDKVESLQRQSERVMAESLIHQIIYHQRPGHQNQTESLLPNLRRTRKVDLDHPQAALSQYRLP